MSQEEVLARTQPEVVAEPASSLQPMYPQRVSPSSQLNVKSLAFKGETEVERGPFKTKGNTPRSRIAKQQTVTGNALTQFGPEQVIVYNEGPISIELGYDGQDYQYPAGEYRTIPALVAFVHWGVIALVDPETNELHFSRPKGPGSQFEDRLSGYAPLSAWQNDQVQKTEIYKHFIDWFSNGVKFKVFRPKTKVRAQEWNALGEAIT